MPNSFNSDEPKNEEGDAPFNSGLHAPSGKELEDQDIDSDDFVGRPKAVPVFFNTHNQTRSPNDNDDKDDASPSPKL